MDFAAACKTSPWGSLLEHLTLAASQSIECAPTPSSSNAKAAWPLCLTLARFAHRISVRTPLSAAVVLGACVYLRRVKARLPPSARGIPTTHHRLLLAALLISSKMLHDHQIKNCTWAQAVGLALVEVNLMERQMLGLLEFNVTLRSSELEAEFDHVNPAKFPGYTSYGSGTWPRIAPAPPSHSTRVQSMDGCPPRSIPARLKLAPLAIPQARDTSLPLVHHQLTPSDPDAGFVDSPSSAMSICSSAADRSMSASLSPMSVTPGWPASPASTTLAVVGERELDDKSTAYSSPAPSPAWSDNTLLAASPMMVGGKSPQAAGGIYKHSPFNDSSVDLAGAAATTAAAFSLSPHSHGHHSLVAITRLTPASPALARLGSAPATTATCTATVAAARAIKSSRRDSGICDIDVTDAAESWKLAANAVSSGVAVAVDTAEYVTGGVTDGVSALVVGVMSAGAGC